MKEQHKEQLMENQKLIHMNQYFHHLLYGHVYIQFIIVNYQVLHQLYLLLVQLLVELVQQHQQIVYDKQVQILKIHHHHQHTNVRYGKPYAAVGLAAFASLGGWFFGYDQGVTGGIVVMSSFKNDFCVLFFFIKAHNSTVWLGRHLPQNRDVFMTCGGSGSYYLWK